MTDVAGTLSVSAAAGSGHGAAPSGEDDARPTRLSIQDLAYTYADGTEAVGGFSVEVPAGAKIGVVGPSGCGKSTLLSLIAGLRRPTSGSLVWAGSTGKSTGRNTNKDNGRDHGHRMSMVFQKDTLLPWSRAKDNVELYARFDRRARAHQQVPTSELFEMAGLQGFEDKFPYQLSGGMRRRVAFLAAIAPSPEVLLLDEPFSSVDEPTRVELHRIVHDITTRLQVTTLLVTHDLAEAVSLCDRVYVLSNRPATVVTWFDIPFGPSRDITHIRSEPEFLQVYGQLWAALSEQIEAGAAARRRP